MKRNAVKHVHKNFTWKNVAYCVNHLYEKVILNNKKPYKYNRIVVLKDFSIKNFEEILLQESFSPRLNLQTKMAK